MVVPTSACRRFEANIFSKVRCQNCFKPRDGHSEEALELAKMSRKVTACGFLYVAPPNIDFSQPSHSAKRWQRRCFTLYDDGELCYALDDNPETVPQIIMNMSRCTRVCEADAITGHAHSILVAFRVDDKERESGERHLPICYVKADTTEEIRWWQNLLQMYAKQNVIHLAAPIRRTETSHLPQHEECSGECKPTVIEVNDSALAQRESACSSRSSSVERRPTELSLTTRTDLGSRSSLVDLPHHGTPRSVKYRNKANKEEPSRKVMSELPVSEAPPPLPQSPCPLISPRKLPISTPFNIDTSNAHTLRKGWLMLRGKNESEWIKHWVVLAGLSLKLYKDVWAEDSTEPLLSIDLTECENVYPSASARNYGIEIKCRRTRYILSAMTPGIRDSWIAALHQNLHNPSPTYAETCQSDAASLPDTDIVSLPPRKKHIAYVAPESHHSNSMMDEESCTDDEFNSVGSRAVRSRQMSISERSFDSSGDELDAGHTSRRRTTQRRHGTREQSISPTVRRSPVSRIKERSTTRQQCVPMRSHGSNSSLSSAPLHSDRPQRRASSRSPQRERSASPQEMRLRSLEFQVQSLREQLHDTTCRLGETRTENERLRYLFMSNDARGLSELRKSLTAAEQDVIKKQQEMETLRKQLITPTSEIENITQCSPVIVDQLISLLKVQVGALSKFVHSTANVAGLGQLRQTTDALIRTVADLDESSSKTTDLHPFENAVEQVSDAYQQLGVVLNVRRVDTTDSQTNTEEEYQPRTQNINDEVQDLENELEELQAAHADELESLRLQYEHQLKSLRERAEFEEQRRKKAQEELHTLNTMNDHSIAAMKKTHEELMEEQKRHFEEEIHLLKEEHDAELHEEKEATRLALDAVQRSHEAEIKSMGEKLRSLGSSLASSQPSTSSDSRYESQPSRQSKMLEQMSAELAQLSALYSAKCLENSQLDEKMSLLLADKENRSSSTDIEMQNRRLQRELRHKDTVIDELRQRIAALERQVADLSGGNIPHKSANHEDGLSAELVTPLVPVLLTSSPLPQANTAGQVVPTQSVRFRKQIHLPTHKIASRRNDVRFHSNPAIPVMEAMPDYIVDEVRRSLAVPVSERRKFFETIAEYNHPF